MFNNSLAKQLQDAINKGKIKPKYFDGYKQWKEKFDYWFEITKDVNQTLNIFYGPNGGVKKYAGSLYVNSSLNVKEASKTSNQNKSEKKNFSHKSSGTLKFIKHNTNSK